MGLRLALVVSTVVVVLLADESIGEPTTVEVPGGFLSNHNVMATGATVVDVVTGGKAFPSSLMG